VERARRHQRLFARLTLALLALVAELSGRSLTHRLDVGRHVGRVSVAGHGYYPFLLAGVKIAAALLLAGLVWRFAKATLTMRRAGAVPSRGARVPIELSPRLWLASFAGTAAIYLVQTDAESLGAGRSPSLAPWLHTSALPVFAVLAVLVALVHRAVEGWLADVELIAAAAVAQARRLVAVVPGTARLRPRAGDLGPRSRFGLAFESRPPPAAA